MIIVQFTGGLGNQLSQYALYREYICQGKKATADLSWYKEEHTSGGKVDARKLELDLMGLEVEPCDSKFECFSSGKSSRILRRLFVGKTYLEEGYAFTPSLLDVKSGYVMGGCFLGEQYIPDAKDEIRSSINFRGKDLPEIKAVREKIAGCNSVSIHMRLGDYLNNSGLYGGICTPEYYKKAIEYIKERVDNPVFFLFSNDIKLASEILKGENFVPVEGNTGDKSYLDMYLMSCCKHNIIANSTFSWWGAWLNDKPGKIVVCPHTLLNGYDNGSVYCDDWIRINP